MTRFIFALGLAWKRFSKPYETRLVGYGRVRRAFGRFSYLFNGFFAGLGTLLLLFLVAAVLVGLVAAWVNKLIALGWKRDVVGFLTILMTSFVLLRYRRPFWSAFCAGIVWCAKGIYPMIVFFAKGIYYAAWTLCCILCPAAMFSLITNVADGFESFLTAPIGIKPERVEQGFGALAGILLTAAVLSGVAVWLMTKLKVGLAQMAAGSQVESTKAP